MLHQRELIPRPPCNKYLGIQLFLYIFVNNDPVLLIWKFAIGSSKVAQIDKFSSDFYFRFFRTYIILTNFQKSQKNFQAVWRKNCCRELKKVNQKVINHPIWSRTSKISSEDPKLQQLIIWWYQPSIWDTRFSIGKIFWYMT